MGEVKGSRFESLFIPRFETRQLEGVKTAKSDASRETKRRLVSGEGIEPSSLRADSFSTLSLSLFASERIYTAVGSDVATYNRYRV